MLYSFFPIRNNGCEELLVTPTRQLLERVFALGYDDLTDADLAAVRDLLLDHIGVAARGSRTDAARAARELALVLGGDASRQLPLIGTKVRAGALQAAFANAVSAHSIEYDDVHNASSTHPGVVVFPAALAAQAFAGADERAFWCGVVSGYEIVGRVGRAAGPAAQYDRHFHPTGTCGHLGAAAAVARILGLDVDAAVSALGIASTMAGGGMRFAADGSSVKLINPAAAARNGVEAALLAQRGYDGGPDAIAGPRGFFDTFSGEAQPELLLSGFGERPLELRNTSIKAHTCCRYNQGPIDALLELRRIHALAAEGVESIQIGMLSAGMDLVARPVEAKREPRSVVDAQFSMPFAAAVALTDGRANLEQYRLDRLGDKRIRELMARVECVADPELDRGYPERWAAWARVRTRDGRTLEARVAYPKGDPENPFSKRELREKFAALTAPVYSAARRAQIFAALERCDQPGSLKQLLELLPGDLEENRAGS